MAVMLGNLYVALREIGVSEDRAQKAAEEAAASSDVVDLKKDVANIKADVANLRADIAVMKWMMGFLLASLIGGFSLVLRYVAH